MATLAWLMIQREDGCVQLFIKTATTTDLLSIEQSESDCCFIFLLIILVFGLMNGCALIGCVGCVPTSCTHTHTQPPTHSQTILYCDLRKCVHLLNYFVEVITSPNSVLIKNKLWQTEFQSECRESERSLRDKWLLVLFWLERISRPTSENVLSFTLRWSRQDARGTNYSTADPKVYMKPSLIICDEVHCITPCILNT